MVSFFEGHTDIIVKKRREAEYDHKIFITGSASTMILECLIVRGSPSDTTSTHHCLKGSKSCMVGIIKEQAQNNKIEESGYRIRANALCWR